MNHTRRFLPALLTVLLMAAVLMPATAAAQDKLSIATVNMQKLVKSYYRTKQVEKLMATEQEGIKEANNERLARIRQLEDQLETLNKRLEDPTTSDKKKQELAKERKVKYQEAVELERERKEFVKRRDAALKEKFAQNMQSIFEDIDKLVKEQAKLANYDYVFDKSAQSIAQVPVFLYAKDAVDITEKLTKMLNKDAPLDAAGEDEKSSE